VPAALSAATGLAFDSSGNLYIAESTAYRLSRMTPDGITTPYAGMSFNTVSAAPRVAGSERVGRSFAAAVDRFGTVYVADPAGQLQRITSNCPLSSPYFDAVPGVASDAQGNINFSDPQHGIVWRLPAAPPPSRGSLQFRFVSADYPTAGQKRRLTTRHRP
jgi:sugar lactone lactonase YvrE